MYGGSWAEYLDTPVYVTEMLLRIEEISAPAPAAPLGSEETTPTIS